MKKLLVASLLCTASLAQAHDLWVTAPATLSPSETLKADLSYSHDFPYPDEIPADRLHIFEPLHITSPDGTKRTWSSRARTISMYPKASWPKAAM